MPDSPRLGRGEQAILHPSQASPITVARHRPVEDLRGWIAYVWVVRWSTPTMHRQAVIPQPVVHVAAEDGELTRVEQLADRAGVSVRTLQRLFGEYVGIGPKWVIQRCRLLDVAAVANSGQDVDWATVAADLGFSDQAHLTRAFTVVVGTPPARYAREVRDGAQR